MGECWRKLLPRQVLPNLERALIPIEKLRDYVLNPDHPVGRNKARVFKSVLGMERKHAFALAEIIRDTLGRAPAVEEPKTSYGTPWLTYHEIIGLQGLPAIVSVVWFFKLEDPETPVLVTCYIDTKRQTQLAALFT